MGQELKEGWLASDPTHEVRRGVVGDPEVNGVKEADIKETN